MYNFLQFTKDTSVRHVPSFRHNIVMSYSLWFLCQLLSSIKNYFRPKLDKTPPCVNLPLGDLQICSFSEAEFFFTLISNALMTSEGACKKG